MTNADMPSLPEGKYNKWCEKRPIVDENTTEWDKADKYSTRSDLTPYEKSAFYIYEHTKCKGLEFVAFSNVDLKRHVTLNNKVILVPCFLTDLNNRDRQDPLLQPTLNMMSNARLVYDGWIPIEKWETLNVRTAIRNIDEALSIFSLRGRSYFHWEPKYPEGSKTINLYHNFHLKELEQIMKYMDDLGQEDRKAVYQSLGWLSKGIHLDNPIVRFLFSILAIESLAVYIERMTSDQSVLFSLRAELSTKSELTRKREECIDKIISELYETNRIQAITKAYSECVGSLTNILKNHVRRIFEPDHKAFDLLFEEKVDGKSLYDLRHTIAHGSADILSEVERARIHKRVWYAEATARKYIITILGKAQNTILNISSDMFAASFSPFNGVMNRADMYTGPTHMALLYS